MKNEIEKNYFEELYRENPDPWNFASSPYELEKYRHTLDALSQRQFEHALEIGCSIGVFTEMLSPYCRQLLAIDLCEEPLIAARQRLHDKPWVSFMQAKVPDQYPPGSYDLIVLSEVGYYLGPEELSHTRSLLYSSLAESGILCLVHWRPAIAGCTFTGDEVHRFLGDTDGLRTVDSTCNAQYRIDILKRHAG